jgi:hypothetical protein
MEIIIIILIFCCCCCCLIILGGGGYYYIISKDVNKPLDNKQDGSSTNNNQDGSSTNNNTSIQPTTTPITTTPIPILYPFTSHTFTNANATGSKGPTLSAVKSAYSSASWTKNIKYLNMINNDGIQLWTVPKTGNYKIQALGASGGKTENYGRGRDIDITTILNQGEVIKILVGQKGTVPTESYSRWAGGGGGGTFVVRDTQTPIIVAGGGGGFPQISDISKGTFIESSNAQSTNDGASGGGKFLGQGGINGLGGNVSQLSNASMSGGGGGLLGSGYDGITPSYIATGGKAFIYNGQGGLTKDPPGINGGFGGGGSGGGGGGGGGGYSGGGAGGYNDYTVIPNNSFYSGGGGGSYAISTMNDNGAINIGDGKVIITLLD